MSQPIDSTLLTEQEDSSDTSESTQKSSRNHRIMQENIDEELACPICQDIMKEVYATSCGHSFCHECITAHMEIQSDCPLCRTKLSKSDLHPNFQLNKLAEYRLRAFKEKVPILERKDPIESIIKESKKDNTLIATSLAKLLPFKDLLSIFQTALEQKKKSEVDESKIKNQLLQGFLAKLEQRNKKQIHHLLTENTRIQTDVQLISNQESISPTIRKRKYADIYPYNILSGNNNLFDDDIEAEESVAKDESIEETSDSQPQGDSQTSLVKRMDDRFDDLRRIYHNTFSVNESINKRRKLLTQFSSTLYELTRYDQHHVIDTLYYTDSNRLQSTTSIVSSIEFDRDEEFFAVGGVTKDIKVYDYSLMGVERFSTFHCPLKVMICGHKISCLSWSPYIKSQIASSDYEGVIDVWDVSIGKKTHSFNEHKLRAWSVDICQQNPTLLASASDDTTVKIWSLTQNKSVFTLEQKGNVCCAKFAPNRGHYLAIGSADHHITCYDLRFPTHPVKLYQGHKKAVSYVRWLNDNEIVSASTDSTLKLWDKESTECIKTFRGHQNEKNFVGLSVNGDWISCGSELNTLYTYHKSSSQPVIKYKFPKATKDGVEETPVFVSSVCWKKDSTTVLAANSKGIINVLEMK